MASLELLMTVLLGALIAMPVWAVSRYLEQRIHFRRWLPRLVLAPGVTYLFSRLNAPVGNHYFACLLLAFAVMLVWDYTFPTRRDPWVAWNAQYEDKYTRRQ